MNRRLIISEATLFVADTQTQRLVKVIACQDVLPERYVSPLAVGVDNV